MKKILLVQMFLILGCILITGCNSNQARMSLETTSQNTILNIDIINPDIPVDASDSLFVVSDILKDEVRRIYVRFDKELVRDQKLNFKDGIYFVLKDGSYTSIDFDKNKYASIYTEYTEGLTNPEVLNYQIPFEKFDPEQIKGMIVAYNTKYYDIASKRHFYKDMITYIPLSLVKTDKNHWKVNPINETRSSDLSDGFDLLIVNTISDKTKDSLFQKLN